MYQIATSHEQPYCCKWSVAVLASDTIPMTDAAAIIATDILHCFPATLLPSFT